MNLIFLTMSKIQTISKRDIYTDLMLKFRNEGHQVYVVSPCERRDKKPTRMIESDGVYILSVKTLNVQKTNIIEKGLGQVSLDYLYKWAINKYFGSVKFDLILYSTPPITLIRVIKSIKHHNPQSMSYLLLKDIFPQNAVDLCMLSKRGIKGILYKSFRKKEKKLYAISDYIGCMSPANVKYLLEHNPEVDCKKVEIAPNSFELTRSDNDQLSTKLALLEKYDLPVDKPIFIYGGNMGKPQGIPFLIECLDVNSQREDCHFLMVGDGFEYSRLESWHKEKKPKNVTLMRYLIKEDYDKLVQACDVGLIFLDYRFTIPNYPSRLLSYLENKMPLIACTDTNSDVGLIAENEGYGFYCPSNDVLSFTHCVNRMLKSDIREMGKKGYQYMEKNYQPCNTYNAIMNHFND